MHKKKYIPDTSVDKIDNSSKLRIVLTYIRNIEKYLYCHLVHSFWSYQLHHFALLVTGGTLSIFAIINK